MMTKKYEIEPSARFARDEKRAKRRGLDIELLWDIIYTLADDQPLPEKNRDHALGGDWRGYRECHIQPDWLLVYKKDDGKLVLVLARTGSHSDLDF